MGTISATPFRCITDSFITPHRTFNIVPMDEFWTYPRGTRGFTHITVTKRTLSPARPCLQHLDYEIHRIQFTKPVPAHVIRGSLCTTPPLLPGPPPHGPWTV